MSNGTDKLTIDVQDLTLEEMAQALELAGPDTEAAGYSFRNMAALACVTLQRSNPEFTYEQALKLKMNQLNIVEEGKADPEVPGADTGAAQQS